MPVIPALSIARSLLEDLAECPFAGQVRGLFKRACNLIDADERVITLAFPEIGNGPFSILVESNIALFDTLELNQPVIVNDQNVMVGSWSIRLDLANVWEPKITRPAQPFKVSPTIAEIIATYTDWPRLDQDTPVTESLVRLARQATTELARAMAQNTKVEAAAAQLAGLGAGLTPAGDDYLVGVMVGLWLMHRTALLPKIAQATVPKTTALSGAFLKAAARGEFVEPWHGVAQALLAGDAVSVAQTTGRLAQFGASSGLDALAGFATTLLADLGYDN